MILRIVRGHVVDEDLEGLRAAITKTYERTARVTAGLRRFHAATRPNPAGGHDLVVLTTWASVDAALRAYDGDLGAIRTLEDLSPHADLQSVAYFELDELLEHRPVSDASRLRLTVGRVARGADADIQRELRVRMADLGPLVIEAYVARRIVAGDVEVAFVSTWEGEDPARPLGQAFWPHIAADYDAFEVGVYDVIVGGEGTA